MEDYRGPTTMKVHDIDIYPCEAIVQILSKDGANWMDYCTIKDKEDCRLAEQYDKQDNFRIYIDSNATYRAGIFDVGSFGGILE